MMSGNAADIIYMGEDVQSPVVRSAYFPKLSEQVAAEESKKDQRRDGSMSPEKYRVSNPSV